MYVSWGKNTRYRFTSGGKLRTWTPPELPAVFAVTYKQNPDSKPKAHTALYFGCAENLSAEIPAVSMEIHELWNRHAGNVDELFVFMHPMPGSTRGQRERIRSQLVAEYAPAANVD